MKAENFIEKKIRKNAAVKTNYRSSIDGQRHFIQGFLTGQTKDSFLIEGRRYHDVVHIPKKNIISMIFEKPNDAKLKPAVIPDPITEKLSKKKEVFSYSNWWKGDHIQEGDK